MKRFPVLLSAAAALTLIPMALAQNAAASDHATNGKAANGASSAHAANGGGNVTLSAPPVGATPTNAIGAPSTPVAPPTGPVAPPTGPVIAGTGNGPGPGNGNGNGNGNAGGNGHAQPKDHAPDPHASGTSSAIQSILQKFDASRDQIVQQRQTLVDKLAGAKDATERKAIEQELKAEEQSMQAQAKATAKEIRAELQALRRQRTSGGG